MYKGLGKWLYEWCLEHGYDPFVLGALIPLFLLFLQRNDLSHFKTLAPHYRHVLMGEMILAAFATVLAIAEVAGLLPKR